MDVKTFAQPVEHVRVVHAEHVHPRNAPVAGGQAFLKRPGLAHFHTAFAVSRHNHFYIFGMRFADVDQRSRWEPGFF